jgi:hypothetical protein
MFFATITVILAALNDPRCYPSPIPQDIYRFVSNENSAKGQYYAFCQLERQLGNLKWMKYSSKYSNYYVKLEWEIELYRECWWCVWMCCPEYGEANIRQTGLADLTIERLAKLRQKLGPLNYYSGRLPYIEQMDDFNFGNFMKTVEIKPIY